MIRVLSGKNGWYDNGHIEYILEYYHDGEVNGEYALEQYDIQSSTDAFKQKYPNLTKEDVQNTIISLFAICLTPWDEKTKTGWKIEPPDYEKKIYMNGHNGEEESLKRYSLDDRDKWSGKTKVETYKKDYVLLNTNRLTEMLTHIQKENAKYRGILSNKNIILQKINEYRYKGKEESLEKAMNVKIAKLDEMEQKLKRMIEVYSKYVITADSTADITADNYSKYVITADSKPKPELNREAIQFLRNNLKPSNNTRTINTGNERISIGNERGGGRKSHRKSKLNKRRKTNRRRR